MGHAIGHHPSLLKLVQLLYLVGHLLDPTVHVDNAQYTLCTQTHNVMYYYVPEMHAYDLLIIDIHVIK